jgi:hypothetical protein
MGSDNEKMIHQFMEERAATDTNKDEHMMILMWLLQFQVA